MKNLKALAILAIFICAFYLAIYASSHGFARYSFLTAAIIVFISTILTARKYYKAFNAEKNQHLRSQLIAKQKFLGEIAAAFALSVFIGVYFNAGYEIDKNNMEARDDALKEATRLIGGLNTKDYCASKPYRTSNCESMEHELQQIFWALSSRNENDIQRHLFSLQYSLTQMVPDRTREEVVRLQKAKSLLEEITFDNKSMNLCTTALQLMLLISAGAAVSRKLAVAAYDFYRL